ncbi:MAG: hypothetical protein WBN92_05115 [Terriglobia bacterium]
MNINRVVKTSRRTSLKGQWASLTVALLCLAILAWTGTVMAQGPVTPTQFDITGFLQEATLGGPGTGTGAGAHAGGSLKVNGHVVIVPSETIVILPANALTWQELFAQSPAPYTGLATGLAMADVPTPLTQYAVEAVGNRVGDTYIAGLIYISQQSLNNGAGFINFIDYSLGEMRVGGVIGDSTTGTRVRINDPTGKFGRAMSPDMRFTLDPDNPTIMSGTGFPMCLPRVTADPSVAGNADDPLCPLGNRPKDLSSNFVGSFSTNDPVAAPGAFPDATKQAPFEVGDYISFAGTLVTDNAAAPTAGPWPVNGTAGTYISAHTITSNVAIFTMSGTNPVYVETDVFLIGTGGLTVLGGTEATVRTRFEGMTTDPTRTIHLYGIDLATLTGATTDRDWGTIGVDPGPPAGAVRGRWRFRPPCAPFGTIVTKPDKQCVMNASGTFLPPTREMRSVVEGAWVPGQTTTSANGLIYGQYHVPILTYIFPENIPGSPVVPNNFEAIQFLACGGYTSSAGTLAGQLNPWPGAAAPSLAGCPGSIAAPVANAGPVQTVTSGAAVSLNGTASTGTAPLTFAWIQAATDIPQVALTGANTATPSFTAPLVAATTVLNFTLTVTNGAGSSSASMTVTVNPAPPTVNPITALTVVSGSLATMTATCTDPQGLVCTFSWLQTSPAAPIVLTPNPFSGATISFTLTLPVGTTTSTVLQFQVTATNSAGLSSAPVLTSVTVNPSITAPVANAGSNQTVASGAAVSLNGNASTGTAPLTFSWVQAATDVPQVLLTNAGTATPSFTAPIVGATTVLNFTLTVTNSAGSSSASMTVTVNAAVGPTVNPIAALTVGSGTPVTMTATCTDPQGLACTFSWLQTAPAAPIVLTPNPFSGATISFTLTLPVGTTTNTVLQFQVTAKNSAGVSSLPVLTSVTVTPPHDGITIVTAVYRIGKQRLDLTVTDTIVSPNVILTLQPYITKGGTLFTPPNGKLTNNGNGNYVITLVGAPEPAVPPAKPLVVKSNLGGASAPTALTTIRQ